jgi:hypothetical protein
MTAAARCCDADLAVQSADEACEKAGAIVTLFRRLQTELSTLAASVCSSQTALGETFDAVASLPEPCLRELQRLDLIEQTLHALAGVAGYASIAAASGGLDLKEATKLCRLSDLAARLCGSEAQHGSDASLELF